MPRRPVPLSSAHVAELLQTLSDSDSDTEVDVDQPRVNESDEEDATSLWMIRPQSVRRIRPMKLSQHQSVCGRQSSDLALVRANSI